MRANGSEEADGDLSHLQMEACARQMNSSKLFFTTQKSEHS